MNERGVGALLLPLLLLQRSLAWRLVSSVVFVVAQVPNFLPSFLAHRSASRPLQMCSNPSKFSPLTHSLKSLDGSVLRTVVFSVSRFCGDGFGHTYKAFVVFVVVMGVAFFSSSYRFLLSLLPRQHKNPERRGETKALRFAKMTSFVDEWVGICEVVKGCRTYGRVFFSLENLVLGYLDVEEFE